MVWCDCAYCATVASERGCLQCAGANGGVFLLSRHLLCRVQASDTWWRSSLGEESVGLNWLSPPGIFRWKNFEPFEQTIVSNGFQIWVYHAELEQANTRFVSNVLEQGAAQLLAALVIKQLGQIRDFQFVQLGASCIDWQIDGNWVHNQEK